MYEGIITGYSVGKVRVPAGLSNRLPAGVVLSIEQEFWVCQGEKCYTFGDYGTIVPDLVVRQRGKVSGPRFSLE